MSCLADCVLTTNECISNAEPVEGRITLDFKFRYSAVPLFHILRFIISPSFVVNTNSVNNFKSLLDNHLIDSRFTFV